MHQINKRELVLDSKERVVSTVDFDGFIRCRDVMVIIPHRAFDRAV